MAERVNINPERGIAEVVAYDEVTIDEMKKSQRQIVKAVKEYSLSGLLYDGRLITKAPCEDDLFDFAKKSIKRGDYRSIQFAMLSSHESALPYMHLTLPLVQHGHYVQVFAERQAALEWLGDGHEEDGGSSADDP